ncbi:MAG: hypothetical protein EU529_00085 [Promethearchaeota archaeon]|nr:MAG: hypothetical protein EU529_00085 [Candidatus Lokiarchaeota archaeon]
MRWILDSCTIIYLVKTNLFENFIKLIKYPLVIDNSVYEEVITDGKANNYSDAFKAEKLLKRNKIPVISIDISEDLVLFRDAGETSCYILARDDGICITSDDRAYKKFINQGQKAIRLDTFFFNKCIEKLLTENNFIEILKKLESVNATKPKSILFFIEKLKEKKKEEIK